MSLIHLLPHAVRCLFYTFASSLKPLMHPPTFSLLADDLLPTSLEKWNQSEEKFNQSAFPQYHMDQHLHPHVLPSSQELYVFLLTPCAPEPRCLDLCKKILFLWICKLSLELIFPSSYHSILLLLLAAKFLKEMSILSPIPLLTVPLKTLHSAFQPYDPI